MTKQNVNLLFEQLLSLQSNGNDGFTKGMFPSYRSNKRWFYNRKDNNVFATASVFFVLESVKNKLCEDQQNLLDHAKKKAIQSFDKYQNKDGLETYNFWETKPSRHFPNGYFMQYFKHFKLPEDIDDTAVIYTILDKSKNEVEWLREKALKHAPPFNKNRSWAYSTWFGQDMPYEKDLCALSNLIYCFLNAGLELNEHDFASIRYLEECLSSGKYLSEPFQVARHYASSPLIIYHLARLIGSYNPPFLMALKPKLIASAQALLLEESNEMNKLLLHSSITKLGERFAFQIDLEAALRCDFYPFIGAPFAPFSNRIFSKIASNEWGIIYWESEALRLAYILENELQKR